MLTRKFANLKIDVNCARRSVSAERRRETAESAASMWQCREFHPSGLRRSAEQLQDLILQSVGLDGVVGYTRRIGLAFC
jgi:hypothetical protein